ERHDRPYRGVRVLATVFPHAGHVTLDVARMLIRSIERRRQQQDERVLAPDKTSIHRVHGSARPARVADPGQHRPALRDRVDLAFRIAGRTERRAVVEVGASIPRAVPGIPTEFATSLEALA